MAEQPEKMERRKPGLANTPIVEEEPDPSNCKVCYWNGVAYSQYARVCSEDGKLLECRDLGQGMRWVVRGRC